MMELAGVSLLLVSLTQGPGVDIRGESLCPTPGEVSRRLAALAPEVTEPLVATLEKRGEGVFVELRNASGALVGSKNLSADSCGVLADAAAIVLATWVRQLHPGELMAAPPSELEAPAPTPTPSRLPWELGASLVGQVQGGAVGLGASLDGSLRFGPRGWGASLALVLPSQGTHVLDVGSVSFRTSSARAGLSWRLQSRSFFDLRAEAVAGLLWLHGHGFDENYTVLRFRPGLGASARLGTTVGPLRPFIAALATGWLTPETAVVVDAAGTQPLPRFELLFAVGCAWGQPP